MKNDRIVKKLVLIAMLAAIAYIMVFVIRIPVVLFLKYEPKDVIITIAGFMMGPMASFIISPTPKVVVLSGLRLSSATRGKPAAAAISMTAVFPSGKMQ